MKRTLIIYILLAGLLLMAVGACTPPPENPKEDEPAVEADPIVEVDPVADEEPVIEEEPPALDENDPSEEPGEGVVTTENVDGTTTTSITPDEEEPVEEEPVVEEDVTADNTFPDDLFAGYGAWPPDSITPDEVEMLEHALVVIETTKGIIKIRMFPIQAPLNSANFVKLIQDGFYDGLNFHRVMDNFMSQGGDPVGDGSGGPGYTIPAEIGLPHIGGSLSAARQGDNVNPQKRSSGSQFYFVHTDTSANFLDGNYTVYGQIVEGLDVNLSLNTNYTSAGPIPGAETDSIVRCWVEYI